MTRPPHPLPYLETTNETYGKLVAETFSVFEPEPGIVVLRGPCPRCGTVIDIPVVSSIVRSSELAATAVRTRDADSAEGHVEPMACTCEDPHPERPGGVYGCGAYWTLILSRPRP